MDEIKSRLTTNEYRDGWDRVFTTKPREPKLLTQPFPLRPDMNIQVTTPDDFELKDLWKLVYYLHTMCVDWKPEMGMPDLTCVMPRTEDEVAVYQVSGALRFFTTMSDDDLREKLAAFPGYPREPIDDPRAHAIADCFKHEQEVLAGTTTPESIVPEKRWAFVDNSEAPPIALAFWFPLGSLMPGWNCPACLCFNGEAKRILEACRACEQRITRT